MSVVGFDISSDTCHVAFIPFDSITYRDVTNKDATNRETEKDFPPTISFDGKQRIIGKLATGYENCFSQVMKIIGKRKSDLKSEPELSCLLEKGPDDLLVVRVSDREKDLYFTATQLLGMILSDLKATAEKTLEVDEIGDCCIGIPGNFSESQRTAVRQAAEIAGLHKVSLLEATTATALGHGIIRRSVHMHDADYTVLVVDIGPSIMQVSMVSLTRHCLDVLSFVYDPCISEQSFVDALVGYFKKAAGGYDDVSLREVCRELKEQSKATGKKEAFIYGGKQITPSMFEAICEPIWDRMKILLEDAVTRASIVEEKISSILVSGPGAKIYGVKLLLEKLFPRQPKAAEKHVMLAGDSVAKGCAIQCAITSKAFEDRKDHPRHTKTKQGLLNFKVSDKWPPGKDKTTEFQVADAIDGRFELMPQEMNDACECERKMALREKMRVNISDMFKAEDFAREKEIIELKKLNDQLDKEDLDMEYLYLKSIEKGIMARKYEHEKKGSVSKTFRNKLKEYEGYLSSKEPKYRTIKITAKDSFKENCEEANEWLRLKTEELSRKLKTDDPISFIDDANNRLKFLEQAWDIVQKQREPDIEVIEYYIKDISSFESSIDDFRARLLKGTNPKEIKGCFVLPHQTEVGGVPYKWFQLRLTGRNGEFTTMHVKHHNVYNMAFDNKEQQTYEMGPGIQPAKKQPEEQHEKEKPKHQNIPNLTTILVSKCDKEKPDEKQPEQQNIPTIPVAEYDEEQPEHPNIPNLIGPTIPGAKYDKEKPDEKQPEQQNIPTIPVAEYDEKQPDEKQPAEEQPDKKQPEIPSLIRLTIPGAKYAGFNCDYISMINPMKLKWTDKEVIQKFVEFEVGIEPWQNAIHVMSYHDCEPEHHKNCPLCTAPHALQRAVMCISIMLNECTRMDALKKAVGDGLGLSELLMEFIWHWRKMSHFLRRWAATKNVTAFLIILAVSGLITEYNADEIGDIMYLILNLTSAGQESNIDDQGPSRQFPDSGGDDGDKKDMGKQAGPPSPSAPGRDGATEEQPQPQPQPPIGSVHNFFAIFSPSAPGRDGATMEQPQRRPRMGHGHNLLQIFSVTLEGINPGDVRDILVHEERGTHVLYSGGGEESSSIHRFKLSGPSIAISSESGCILELTSKSGNTGKKKKGKKKRRNMYGTLMHLDEGFSSYNEHRMKTMPYGNGKLIVSYAILTEAVEANLEVNLLLLSPTGHTYQVPTWLTYQLSGNLAVTQQAGTSDIYILPENVLSCRGGPLLGMHALPTRSISQKLLLSRTVFSVKCGDCIRVDGNVSIGEHSFNIGAALEIPRIIGFIKTVETPWVHDDKGVAYNVSMTLISRNI